MQPMEGIGKKDKRIAIYENKIKLMEQQIDGLRKDLEVKVKMDKRKLRFIRDYLNKIDDAFIEKHYGHEVLMPFNPRDADKARK